MKTVADYKVLCNDGTLDISNGAVAPCVNKGGIKGLSNVKSFFSEENVKSLLNGINLGRPSQAINRIKFYKFKEDFVNGVLPNTNGQPNIIFKKGDIIKNDGIITFKFLLNTETKGIMAKPTVVGARVESTDGLVFVPLTSVELVSAEEIAKKQIEDAVKQQNPQLPTKNTDSVFKKIAGSYNKNLIIAGLLVVGYFAYKKFKK
jgi:hypothetical protein